MSRAGICNDRPRCRNDGRRGVIGLSFIALSSFDFRFSGSRNLGEGDNAGGPLPSERERAFEVFFSGVPAISDVDWIWEVGGSRNASCN